MWWSTDNRCLLLFLLVGADLVYRSHGQKQFIAGYYGSDASTDHEQPEYPPRTHENFKDVCVLGTVDNYVDWWQHANGTLNVPNNTDDIYFLDLSHTLHTPTSVVYLLQQHFPQPPVANRTMIVLSVAYADLTTVPRRALDLVGSTLELLTLRGNRFHRNDAHNSWDAFPPLPALRELDLSACRIATLSAGFFDGMPELQRLYLGHNRIETLAPTTFDSLSSLFHLDLSHNFNTDDDTVPPPSHGSAEGLFIPPHMFADMKALLFLDMSYSRLYVVTAVRSFAVLPKQLEHLSLCYTAMPQLPPHIFADTNIKVLDLSGNPTLAFNLHYSSLHDLADTVSILAMDDANLKSLEYFCTLVRLRVLLLSGNNINSLYTDAFKGLDALQVLDLSANHLSNWYQPVFVAHTPQLRLLKLHDNNINLITPAMFRDFVQLNFLAIGNNDFVCSCSLRDFMDVAAANSRHTMDCPLLHPHLRRRVNVSATLAEQVQVHYRAHGLTHPRVLHATVQRPYDVAVRLHITDMMAVAESVGNMSLVKRKMLEYNVMTHRRHIGLMSEPAVTAGSYHSVRRIGDEIMNFTFQLLDFHVNRYKCINSTSSAIYQLNEIDHCTVHDRDVIDEETSDELMREAATNIVAAVLGSVFGMLLAYFVVYYYWWYFRFVWMTLRNSAIMGLMNREQKLQLVRRRRTIGGVEGAEDNEQGAAMAYAYDVFVSYSEPNRDWILEEFLPNMDQCSDIRVCLHERDFQVGLSILENIINCMDESRCILLVVSENFLLSQWCQFEMHLAQHRLLETRRDQLILILLEDIPRRKRPQTLHYLMRTKTYIKWPTAALSASGNKEDKKKPGNAGDVKMLTNKVKLERRQFWRRLKRALADNEWEEERPVVVAETPSHKRLNVSSEEAI